jgi:hypothetical protein
VGYSLCICKSMEERRKGETHTHARLLRRIERGGVGWGTVTHGEARGGTARQWARAHDMGVNGLLKSDPKLCWSGTSFYRLYLLQAHG